MAAMRDNSYKTKDGRSRPPSPRIRLSPAEDELELEPSECSFDISLPSNYASSHYENYEPTIYAESTLSLSPKSTAESPTHNTPTGFSLASHLSPVKSTASKPTLSPPYNQSTLSASHSLYSSPAKSTANSQNKCSPYTRPVQPELYYTTSTATRREPITVYNKSCGVPYKSVGGVTRNNHSLMRKLVNSEQLCVMEAICLIYHYRNNTIRSAKALSVAQIRGIFELEFIHYQFSVVELYKRMAMRKGAMIKYNANTMNFHQLPSEEVDRFIRYLDGMGTWRTRDGKDIKLFSFDVDKNGQQFLKVNNNQFTLNMVQLINSIYDNMRQWTGMVTTIRKTYSGEEEYEYGAKWIENTMSTPPFFFC